MEILEEILYMFSDIYDILNRNPELSVVVIICLGYAFALLIGILTKERGNISKKSKTTKKNRWRELVDNTPYSKPKKGGFIIMKRKKPKSN